MHAPIHGPIEPAPPAPEVPWRKKARRVLEELCSAAYAAAAAEAKKKRRKRIDYSVPDDARDLITFLNKNDEEGAKALMLRLNFWEVEKWKDQR